MRNNPGMDIDWIREGLKQPGKTQRGLAAALGIDAAAVSRLVAGDRQLKAKEIAPAAAYLGVQPPIVDLTNQAQDQRQGGAVIPIPAISTMPKDVPVYGTVVGGAVGDFEMNGEIVDRVRRPPGLDNVRGAFALYVSGDSMEPRYEPGELIYVNPTRQPRPGDYIVIELFPRDDGDSAGPAYIKKLVSRTSTAWLCEQFNPKTIVEYQVSEVKRVFRIVTTSELLGV